MPFITIGTTSQLQIKVPTRGSTGWDETMRTDTFLKIATHDHTGASGKGVQLSAGAFADDTITGAKILLANDEYLRGRNQANSGNINLAKINTSDEVEFGASVGTIEIQDDGLTIVDNADNTKVIALNAASITTGTTRTLSSPDATGTIVLQDDTATLTNKSIDSDNNTITNIVNADIKASAAIAVDKLAAVTASRAVVSDGSGFVSAATTTATEIGYVNGVTSAIQTQLDTKVGTSSTDTLTNKTIDSDNNTITNIVNADIKAGAAIDATKIADGSVTSTEFQYINTLSSNAQTQIDAKLPTTITTTGDIIYSSSGTTASRLGIGSAGQVLQVSGGVPAWATNTASPVAVTSINNGDSPYTALTTDDTIKVDTSAGAVTVNLYAASGNSGRKLKIVKTTSDSNDITVDGNASETINGSTTKTIQKQYEALELICDGSNWLIVGTVSTFHQYIAYSGHAGYGSTNTSIPYFTTQDTNTGESMLTITNDSTNGFAVTATRDCVVTMSWAQYSPGGAHAVSGISLNSNQLTTNPVSITAAHRVCLGHGQTGSFPYNMTASVKLASGDVLRPHGDKSVPGNTARPGIVVTAVSTQV